MTLLSWLAGRIGASASSRSRPTRRQTRAGRQCGPLLQVEQLENRWCLSYTLITSRAALAATDSVDWGVLGPQLTQVANPFTILSTAGQSVRVSKPLTGDFSVREQCASEFSGNCSWSGNFATADKLLWTNTTSTKSNPITLDFGGVAVTAGGAQIQAYRGDTYTAKVEALDGRGKTLATFTAVGTVTSSVGDNSALFIGIRSDSATIHKIALSITRTEAGLKGSVTINRFDFTPGAAALIAERQSEARVGEGLTQTELQPLATEALARWQAAGVDTSAFAGIDVRIADLGGTTLGLAAGHTIWLDDNAAGWGWFVDATPWDDSEFTTPGNQGEQNRMDLLTVLEHELGHLLGFDHQETGVMEDTLATGTRKTPTGQWIVQDSALLDLVFAAEQNPLRRRFF
jgi:hypothetical protein